MKAITGVYNDNIYSLVNCGGIIITTCCFRQVQWNVWLVNVVVQGRQAVILTATSNVLNAL